MIFDEVYKESRGHTLKTAVNADGQTVVTCPLAPKEQWVGADLREALTKARNALHEREGTRNLQVQPAWMTDPARFKAQP